MNAAPETLLCIYYSLRLLGTEWTEVRAGGASEDIRLYNAEVVRQAAVLRCSKRQPTAVLALKLLVLLNKLLPPVGMADKVWRYSFETVAFLIDNVGFGGRRVDRILSELLGPLINMLRDHVAYGTVCLPEVDQYFRTESLQLTLVEIELRAPVARR